MNTFKLLSAEFGKLAANKAILFSVIAALLVPVVYGGILLSATWGPYDNLSNLPVAVVNNDRGAVNGDQAINVGDDLVANMKDGKDLGWKFVSSTEAMKGLQKNDYYMAIIIPEDFSERVTTVLDPNPKKLELEYIQNEGLNFLASKVTETATQRMREKLADTITQKYVANMFASLGEVSEGFGKAADGSSQLADGTSQLHEGTNELLTSVTSKQSDITKLANGTKELKSGTGLLLSKLNEKSGDINKLADGSQQLHEGSIKVLAGLQKAENGSEELRNGVAERLVPGSRKVADGTGRLKDGSAKLAAGAQRLVAGLEEYKKANPTVNVGPYYQQIIDGAKEISSGLDNLSTKTVALNEGAVSVADGIANKVAPGTVALNDGLNQLVAGQTKLEAGAAQIADGNAKVDKGWNELISGVTRLDSGAGKISDGNAKVDEGWKKLSQGATKLNDGAGKINAGSEKLTTGLKSGAEKTGGLNTENDNINMFASPVQLKSKSVNEYEHYRDSTAPYVLTLGLFVGILIMSLFIDFKRPSFISSFNWFTVKFLKLASLALVQAILLLIVVLFVLKVNVSNPGGLILFALVASVAFSAIVLFLAAFGGNLGRFVALGLVIMQLSITGANLPIEMLPEEYRSLSQYLPFTYSIAGFKSVITLNDFGAALSNMAILLTFLLVFALLAFVVFNFKKDRVVHDQKREVTA